MPSASNGNISVDVNLFVYNGVATVGPAIESVLAQTWPAFTLTLIDDGSTDGTTGVLARYVARDPRIRAKAQPLQWRRDRRVPAGFLVWRRRLTSCRNRATT